jgi:hypothetical protein
MIVVPDLWGNTTQLHHGEREKKRKIVAVLEANKVLC